MSLVDLPLLPLGKGRDLDAEPGTVWALSLIHI